MSFSSTSPDSFSQLPSCVVSQNRPLEPLFLLAQNLQSDHQQRDEQRHTFLPLELKRRTDPIIQEIQCFCEQLALQQTELDSLLGRTSVVPQYR